MRRSPPWWAAAAPSALSPTAPRSSARCPSPSRGGRPADEHRRRRAHAKTMEAKLGDVEAISHSWSDDGSLKLEALQTWRAEVKSRNGGSVLFVWLDKACIDQADIQGNISTPRLPLGLPHAARPRGTDLRATVVRTASPATPRARTPAAYLPGRLCTHLSPAPKVRRRVGHLPPDGRRAGAHPRDRNRRQE